MYIFGNMVLHGLFQTRDYAYEVLREGRTPEGIEELVNTRLERQEVLNRVEPPRIVAVFDEGVVRRPIGDAKVMREQIRHLIEIAERSNVTMQIVPSVKGAYAGIMGAFTTLGRKDESAVVYVEGHTSGQFIDDPDEVEEYALRFDLIRGVAMSADESLKLLRVILESL